MNLSNLPLWTTCKFISIAVLWESLKKGCELFAKSPETQLELSNQFPVVSFEKSQPYPYREIELQVK